MEMYELAAIEYTDLKKQLQELETDATKIGEELKALGECLMHSPGSVAIDTRVFASLQAELISHLIEAIKQLQMKKAKLEQEFPELGRGRMTN